MIKANDNRSNKGTQALFALAVLGFLGCQADEQASVVDDFSQVEEISGEAIVTVVDYSDGTSDTHYSLQSKDGRLVELNVSAEIAGNVRSGDKITVQGETIGLGSADEASSVDEFHVRSLARTPYALSVNGVRKVAMILVSFSNNSSQPFSKAQAESILFDNNYSAAAYYDENSYGKLSVSGEVINWMSLDMPSSEACTLGGRLRIIRTAIAEADSQLSAPLSEYNHFSVAYANKRCAPNYNGAATSFEVSETINGQRIRAGYSWINGFMDLETVGHELGHNMGLQHGNGRDCGADIIEGNSCRVMRYYDIFDIMGNQGVGHLNALHKEQLDILDDSQVIEVYEDSTIDISPMAIDDNQPKVIKVPKVIDGSGNVTEWYYVEYRQPVGFDREFPAVDGSFEADGVLIHVKSLLRTSETDLLDMTPESRTHELGDFRDAFLPRGDTFTDATAPISIKNVRETSTFATIEIDVPESLRPPLPDPDPTPMPTPTPRPDDDETEKDGGSKTKPGGKDKPDPTPTPTPIPESTGGIDQEGNGNDGLDGTSGVQGRQDASQNASVASSGCRSTGTSGQASGLFYFAILALFLSRRMTKRPIPAP